METKLGPWLLRRLLCCTGFLVFVQNLMLLHWTAQIRLPSPQSSQSPAPSSTSSSSAATSSISEASRELAAPEVPKRSADTKVVKEKPEVKAEAKLKVAHLGSLDSSLSSRQLGRESSLFSVTREELRLFGEDVPESVSIAVGFGSVKRQKDYVAETVGIMLGLRGDCQITPEERAKVVIVAHFADFNSTWVSYISKKLVSEYRSLVDEGHFHGIHAPEELYPPLDLCPPHCHYKDDAKRVKWRSKQNVDYAFLMYYAASLAPYYLQLEDDLNFASNWISKISGFISSSFPPSYRSKENAPWRLIDFSQLGFIGKMFQSDELTRLAQFLLLFYDQMPCDILLAQWVLSMTQGKKIEYWKSHNSLFQHVGIFRSLGGFQTLQEKKFGKGTIFDNPAGEVFRNLTIVPTYDVRFIYWPGGEPANRNDVCDFTASPQKQKIKRCWLWGKNLQRGQHVTLTFQKQVAVKALLIEFGNGQHGKDLLRDGMLQVADETTSGCGSFHDVVAVKQETTLYWEEGASEPPHLPVPVRCLRILVLQGQSEWMIISQIQIRSS